ncbi:oligosaccharide flippase family protein [Methylobacterium sp. Leaf89]|uniref:oligosaccharide flippase family protein n=1 Tax=Methylobacterium sp. Leaf89 TaxID=1736245 RepID=UPI0009EAE23D|nr:oligosaccharide flippase family protein [Methylobacterium sp. Leaf89]
MPHPDRPASEATSGLSQAAIPPAMPNPVEGTAADAAGAPAGAGGGTTARAAIFRGSAFLFGRQIISIFLKFIGVLLISRILGPERYGAYVAAIGVYQYGLSLGQAGIGVCLLRHEKELTAEEYGTSYTLLAATALALVVVLEGSGALLAGYVNVEGFRDVLSVLVLAIPLQVLSIPATARAERALDYRSVATIELSGQLAYYLIAVPLVLGGSGAVSLAVAWVGQQGVSFVLAHVLTRAWPVFRWQPAAARHLLGYAFSFSAQNWIWQARSLVNPLIVGPAFGATAVGIVGMTVGIVEMLSVLKTIAWRLSVAVLRSVTSDVPRLLRAITQGMELQTLAIGSILLAFAWFGKWIVPLVFGERWLPVLDIYPYLALSYLTMAPFNMHTATLSVLNRNWPLAGYHVVHVALFAGVAAIAVPLYGLRGYGFGEVATLPAYAILHLILARTVGTPDYRLTALWWGAAAIGLFWRELGPWAIAAPFLALLLPPSLRRLRSLGAPLLERLQRRRA